MNSALFYKLMSGFYDLIDVIYFRDYERSPRKAVLESIGGADRVLDLCAGTACGWRRRYTATIQEFCASKKTE